jgi:hypothetical protein
MCSCRYLACRPLSCSQARANLALPTPSPQLILQPPNTSTVFMEFGSPAPFSFLPCVNANQTQVCVAHVPIECSTLSCQHVEV